MNFRSVPESGTAWFQIGSWSWIMDEVNFIKSVESPAIVILGLEVRLRLTPVNVTTYFPEAGPSNGEILFTIGSPM